jgi:hypothetical protein
MLKRTVKAGTVGLAQYYFSDIALATRLDHQIALIIFPMLTRNSNVP